MLAGKASGDRRRRAFAVLWHCCIEGPSALGFVLRAVESREENTEERDVNCRDEHVAELVEDVVFCHALQDAADDHQQPAEAHNDEKDALKVEVEGASQVCEAEGGERRRFACLLVARRLDALDDGEVDGLEELDDDEHDENEIGERERELGSEREPRTKNLFAHGRELEGAVRGLQRGGAVLDLLLLVDFLLDLRQGVRVLTAARVDAHG
eukprot:Amastigsp_a2744_6.p3 type:complete len:211 gc:universal Amastigsp_a2744_6:780-1412(+)